jgi:hypothetical protein
MFITHWVEVVPSMVVTGRMTLDAQVNGLVTCTSGFDNYPATRLIAQNLPPLIDCLLTLEAYATGANAAYPKIPTTEFSAVTITRAAVSAKVAWPQHPNFCLKPPPATGSDLRPSKQ